MKFFLPILAFFWVGLSSVSAQSTHVVQHNQTLYSIARLYNVSVDQLRAWNHLASNAIRVGQTLSLQPAGRLTLINPDLTPFLYTVRTGDSLASLSVKYDTSLETLKEINGLDERSGLYVGQRLYIRRPVGVTFYTVVAGDTPEHVAALFHLTVKDLIAINQIKSPTLVAGTQLRVFKPSEVPLNHTVASMDTPAGIAALYGMTEARLRNLNGPTAFPLHMGETLKLRSYASASQEIFQPAQERSLTLPQGIKREVAFPDTPQASASQPVTYTVLPGDTILKICRASNIKLEQFLAWNLMSADSVLRIGAVVTVSAPKTTVAQTSAPSVPQSATQVSFPVDTPAPLSAASAVELPAFRDADQAKIRWDSYVVLDKSIPVFEWNNDYYYWTHPGETSQPNRGYYENSWPSPLDAYHKAKILISRFDHLIDQKVPLSTILKGVTIVLDPGHGGTDPGAIVKSVDDAGNPVYVTEHEYVYDIALRVYALLKRHGANVVLTILAPNHLIRDTRPSNYTLINEKNQVYNDLSVNASDDAQAWPSGSERGLDRRVDIANAAFHSSPKGKRIFLSIHADNNPLSPLGTGLYALQTRPSQKDSTSLSFAQKMLPFLGDDAYVRTQNLAVLRGNDADFKLLIEVHNLASAEQSHAMRAGSSRQLSAQKIVRGLLEAYRGL